MVVAIFTDVVEVLIGVSMVESIIQHVQVRTLCFPPALMHCRFDIVVSQSPYTSAG